MKVIIFETNSNGAAMLFTDNGTRIGGKVVRDGNGKSVKGTRVELEQECRKRGWVVVDRETATNPCDALIV